MSTDAQACAYAAMILHDAGVAISADKIAAVTNAAGFELRATVPILFANYLAKNSIASVIEKASNAAPAAGGATAAAAAPTTAAPAAGGKKEEPKKEEKKAKAPEPEDDDDFGGIGGLF